MGSLDQTSKCIPLLQLVDAEVAEVKQQPINSFSLDQIRMPRMPCVGIQCKEGAKAFASHAKVLFCT